MRGQIALVGGMLSVALVTVMAQPPNIAGTWNMTFNTDQGSQSATLTIEQDGETFSGSVSGDQGEISFDGYGGGDWTATRGG